jgi:hypothetical protein
VYEMEKDERELEMELDDGDVVAMGKEVEKMWAETTEEVQKQMQALSSCGTVAGVADAAMVPRTNALLQDSMGKLRTLLLRYEMIAQQYPRYVCGLLYFFLCLILLPIKLLSFEFQHIFL